MLVAVERRLQLNNLTIYVRVEIHSAKIVLSISFTAACIAQKTTFIHIVQEMSVCRECVRLSCVECIHFIADLLIIQLLS